MTGVRSTAWGAAWIEVLVLGNTFDGPVLARGRGLAARDAVLDLEVEPGSVAADVVVSRSAPRRVRIGIRRLEASQFDTMRTELSSSARWAAAVLDGDLPHAVHERFVEVGCGLLPGLRDVSIDCSCGNLAESCVHAAAVCSALASAVDRDPLLLVTLRGGDRARLLSGFDRAVGRPLEGRVAAIADRGPDPGMAASASWRRRPAPLPAALDPGGRRRGAARRWSADPPPPVDLGLDAPGLELLVADAARRAAAVLAGETDGLGLDLTTPVDAVRRAAAGGLAPSVVAAAVGCSEPEVDGLVAAWRAGGAPAVDVLVTPSRLDATDVAAVAAASEGPVRARSTGALLDDGRQVRRASDRSWVLLAPDPELGWCVVDVAVDLDDLAFDS